MITLAGLAGVRGSADGTNSSARFAGPSAIAMDASGNLFVAEIYNNIIRKMTRVGTNWVVTTIGGLAGSAGATDGVGGGARFSFPWGMAADDLGNVYVADSRNDTIRLGKPVPYLQVSAMGGQAVLSWPISAADFALETNSDLSLAGVWIPVTNGIVPSGDHLIFTNAIGASNAYFRLHKRL